MAIGGLARWQGNDRKVRICRDRYCSGSFRKAHGGHRCHPSNVPVRDLRDHCGYVRGVRVRSARAKTTSVQHSLAPMASPFGQRHAGKRPTKSRLCYFSFSCLGTIDFLKLFLKPLSSGVQPSSVAQLAAVPRLWLQNQPRTTRVYPKTLHE